MIRVSRGAVMSHPPCRIGLKGFKGPNSILPDRCLLDMESVPWETKLFADACDTLLGCLGWEAPLSPAAPLPSPDNASISLKLPACPSFAEASGEVLSLSLREFRLLPSLRRKLEKTLTPDEGNGVISVIPPSCIRYMQMEHR